MIASNSAFATARSLASMGQESILAVLIHNDNASGIRIRELAHLPKNAAQTAWQIGTSITPIGDEDANTLMDSILHTPDFFPEQTMLGLRIAIFFHPKAPQRRDGIIGLYFEQDRDEPRRILHLRSPNDIDEANEADNLAA